MEPQPDARSLPETRLPERRGAASQGFIHILAEHGTEHRLDALDGLGSEQPLPLARVAGLAVQDDPAQFAAVEKKTGTLWIVGDFLEVDSSDPVEQVFEFEGQDGSELVAGAGMDLGEVQAAGGQDKVAMTGRRQEGIDRVAGTVELGAVPGLGPDLARQAIVHLRNMADRGPAEAPAVVALAEDLDPDPLGFAEDLRSGVPVVGDGAEVDGELAQDQVELGGQLAAQGSAVGGRDAAEVQVFQGVGQAGIVGVGGFHGAEEALEQGPRRAEVGRHLFRRVWTAWPACSFSGATASPRRTYRASAGVPCTA